jgi:hypothetical protein
LQVSDDTLPITDEVEGLLLPLVIHFIHESGESRDSGLQLHVLPRAVGEELCHEEWLRQEPLNLPRSIHHETVFFGQLIQAKDGDN